MSARKVVALVVLCLAFLVQRPSAQSGPNARVYMIDIGQGASTLVVSPTGKTLLMDGGPPGSGAKIIPLLNTLGINTIDFVVLSHYHIDHNAGLIEVLNANRVAGIVYDVGDAPEVQPPGTSTSPTSTRGTYLNYIAAANRPGVTRQTIAPGTVIDLGGGMRATAMVAAGQLLSGGVIPTTHDDLNTQSISLFVEYNNFDFVVAGDLTGGGSTSTNKTPDVESHVGQMIGDVDVVQLSHHGSTTTSSQLYLSTIRAEVALAQTGLTNTFGHPNREIVNRFLNTPTTNGSSFNGTGVPPAGSGPVFYQHEESPVSDDRVTRQGHSGSGTSSAGQGTVLIQTDGTTVYTLSSFDDGGVRIPASIHSYPVDSASPGVTTNFAPTVVVSTSPVVPLSTDSVVIAAAVNDREDPVGGVTLNYSLNGVAQAPVPMMVVGAAYQATIPAQPNGTRVDYAVTAMAGSHTTTYGLGYFSGVTPIASLRVVNVKGEPVFAGYPARINASVTAGSGTFASSTNDDYAQDVTGALSIFRSTETATPFVATSPGEIVEARGRVAFNGGRFRLDLTESLEKTTSPFGITSGGAGAPLSPQAVTIAALNASPESFEGQLVSIASASLVSGSFPSSAQNVDTFVTISDGSGTMQLKIDRDTDVDGFNPGATFPVTGIVQQDDFLRPFDTGYSITPRNRVDLGGTAAGATLITIADARVDQQSNADGSPGGDTVPDLLGQLVRVRGAVTSIDFRGGNGIEYYIQDSTGGVDIFATTLNAGPFAIGDSVEAVGLVAHFNGLTEITIASAADVVVLPPGTMPAVTPLAVTIAQLTNAPTAESLEGRLIRVDNVTVTSGTFPAAGSSANVTITDATGSMVLRVDSDTDIDGTTTTGGSFSVIALASQFDSSSPYDTGYQLLPRSTADIIGGAGASFSASPATVNFGTIPVGGAASATVTITNTGVTVLTLTPPFAVTGTDAGQFSAGAPGTTSLAPGASTTAPVGFAPTAEGGKTATLTVTASGGGTATVALTGTAVGAGTGSPLVISEFRFRGPNGGNDEFVEIYNNTDAPMAIGGYRLNGSNNSGTTSTRATIPAGVTIPARGHFLFTNSGAAGYSGMVPGNQTFSTGVTDDGGIAILKPSPDNTIVDQVGLSVGSAYKEGTNLTSLGSTNLNRGYERKPGGAAGSTIDTGNNSADFALVTPSDPQNLASAITPALSVSPTSLSFGTILTGSSSPSTIAITNSGTSTITLTPPFAVSGADAGQFAAGAPATTTLAAGGSTTVTITYNPATAASHSANVTISSNAGSATVPLSGSAVCPPITVSGAPPSGTVGTPYSASLSASGGLAPYLFSFTGTLPSALTLSAAGVLSGTPDAAGTFAFSVTATAANGCSGSAPFTVTVEPPAVSATPLVISEFRFRGPNGANDEFVEIYNNTDAPIAIGGYRLMGSNNAGTTSTRATIGAGVMIPARGHFLFINGNGTYSGLTPGNHSYSTGITDDGGIALVHPSPDNTIVDQVGLSAGSAFKEGTTLAALTTNVSRSWERKPGGTAGSTTDSNNNAADFVLTTPSDPQNLASPATPSLSVATPVSFGTVLLGDSTTVSISIGNTGTSSITLTPPFAVSGANAGEFTVGSPVATTLPGGSSTTVDVAFTPAGLGPRTASLAITSVGAGSATVSLSGSGACQAIAVSGALPNGSVGVPYSASLSASGGIAPYVFSFVGTLPPPLTLSPSGEVAGTPTAGGTFTFDVIATAANGCSGSASYTMTVIQLASLSATTVDFGVVAAGGSGMQFVTVTNNSAFPVTLTPPFTVSGPDAAEFSAASVSPTIAAHSSVTVPVSFAPVSAGSKSATLTITSSASGTVDVAVAGTGAVKSQSAGLVISEFRFRGPLGGNDEFIEIYNPTSAAIDISGYRLMGSNATGTTSIRATVPAGRTIAAHGHYLFTNSGSNGYSGIVPGNQTYTTGITDEGGVALARPDGMIIDAAGTSSGAAFKEGTPLASLGTGNINRSYERLLGGFDGSNVDTDNNSSDFVVRNPSAPQNSSSASTPSISVTPSAVSFGTINAGTSAAATVTIANVGGGTVTLTTPFAVSGVDASSFSADAPAAATLAPGETTDVNVTFAPTTIGSRTAQLTVATGGGETRVVALSGVSQCPVVTISGTLGAGQFGATYAHVLTGNGGAVPYQFTISSGALPASLTLSSDGQVSGTPSAAGGFTFDVQVSDANGCSATSSYSIDIARAPVTVSWAVPAPIVYGTLLSGTQLNASTGVTGAFAYSPASGAALDAGSHTLSVSFTPDDAANYETASATVSLLVTARPLSAAAHDATREFGTANPGFTGAFSGAVATDGLSASFTSAATPSSPPGSYPIEAAINDPNGRLGNYTVSLTNGTLDVVDTTSPVIDAHGPVAATATSSAGAVVTYTLPATHDAVDGDGVATCLPASGSTFAIGATTVTCTASDAAQNPAVLVTFTVTVSPQPIAELFSELQAMVNNVGPGNSLTAKVQSAQKSYTAGNTSAAAGQLRALLNEVRAQTGKKITAAQASQITDQANQLLTRLGA